MAQAEVEDRPTKGAFHKVRFGVEGGGDFVIATTRPELLPACVAVAAHPDDERYKALFGKRAVTPLFRVPVPIFPSTLVDREKGTGILMVCTFGDATDVQWWREEKLPLRQVVERNGRMAAVEFGDEGWPSLDPEAANAAYEGRLRAAGARGPEDDRRDAPAIPAGLSAGDGEAPLLGEPEPIEHPVKFYEKGDRPLEFITTRQWFVRLLDRRAELIAAGETDRLAPGLHADALPQLDRGPPAGLVHLPPALLRRARSRSGTRFGRTAARDHSRAAPGRRGVAPGGPGDGRAARLRGGASATSREASPPSRTSSTPGSRPR